MFTDQFKHTVGSFLEQQATDLLAKQLSVSKAVYTERTGLLNQTLGSKSFTVNLDSLSVTVNYPKYIRFLDMKRSSAQTREVTKTVVRNRRKVQVKTKVGGPKKVYAPIYNRYVYGYLKSAVYRRLRSAVSANLIQEWRKVADAITGK